MATSFHRTINTSLLCGALVVLAAACNYPGVQPSTEDTYATSAAQTVAAELTQSANGSPQATTTSGQSETATPAATNTPVPPTLTPAPTGCTNQATFIKDVTVPDDSFFEGGDTFTKTWRLENSGTCTWTTDYDLVFDSGNAMDGPAAVAFETNVSPNNTVDLSVDLEAPASDGTYRGYWMLRDGNGVRFGIGSDADVAFWVQIIVGPTPTPAPSVYKTGKLDITASDKVDLDQAAKVSGSDADLLYEQLSASDYSLSPQNGAKINLITSGVPDFNECSTDLSTDKIHLGSFDQGDWICFETGAGRIGRFELEQISGPTPPTLRIDIRTWKQ